VKIVVPEIDLVFGSALAHRQLSNHPERFFGFGGGRMRHARQCDAVAVRVEHNVVLKEAVVRAQDVVARDRLSDVCL